MPIVCVLNKSESLERLGFQGKMVLFKCKVFTIVGAKTLRLSQTECVAPGKIHIATMAEFRKPL